MKPSSLGAGCWFPRIVIATVCVIAAGTAPAAADEYRAFWVDAWGAGLLDQGQVDLLLGEVGNPDSGGRIRDANCNTVFVQVRRRADVCYPSGMGEPYMSGLTPPDFNALQAIIDAAHDTTGGKKRIEVHCWIVDFKTGKGAVYSEHSDPNDADAYWPTRLENGSENSDGAMDPGHPGVLQSVTDVYMDLVNHFDIDGVHHDYIRFEAASEGYNPTSVARYNERYGLTGQPASSSEQFKQWRRDQVTAVVRKVYANIQKTKPWIKHSGAFVTWNPSPESSSRSAFMATRPYYDVYSDWDGWMEEGLVDMGVPMTYYREHTHAADYVRWMNFEKDRRFNRHMIVGPGIYLNLLPNAILHLQKTREASPAGNYADGFSGYSYRVPFDTGTWDGFAPSLLSQVTPTWDDIPDMPWKSAPTRGHLMGTVTHPGGTWADHAVVSITGPTSRSMYVDGTGFYAFIDLPAGLYTITAAKAGHPSAATTADVRIGVVTGNMYERNLVLLDCDDGNLCTTDVNVNGVCVHTPVDCGAGVCNPVTGTCVGCLSAADCDDDDLCTMDMCVDRTCVREPMECDLGVCDPDTGGCVACLVDADCDDEDLCTADACEERVCVHESVDCGDTFCDSATGECVECLADADCDDDDLCTTDTCADGACVYEAVDYGTDVCDPATGRRVGCLVDADCGEDRVCDEASRTCVDAGEPDAGQEIPESDESEEVLDEPSSTGRRVPSFSLCGVGILPGRMMSLLGLTLLGAQRRRRR